MYFTKIQMISIFIFIYAILSCSNEKSVPTATVESSLETIYLNPTDDIVGRISEAKSGSKIILHTGIYEITDEILIQNKLEISISAELLWGTTIKQNTSDKDVFHIESSSDIVISSLILRGAGKIGNTSSEGSAVHLDGCTSCTINNCQLSQFQVAGARLDGSNQNRIIDNLINDIWAYGVLAIASDHNLIGRNNISGIGSSDECCSYGVALTGLGYGNYANEFSDYNTVVENICSNTYWEAFDAHNGTANNFISNVVNGDNKMRRGIVHTAHGDFPTIAPTNGIIANNFIQYCTDGGIVIAGDVPNVGGSNTARSFLIDGNRIGGCKYGMRFHDFSRSTITGNVINGNYDIGLYLDLDNKDILITGNSVSNNGHEGFESTGIFVGHISSSAGANSFITIVGNQIFWDGGSSEQHIGIQFKDPYGNILFSSNTIHGNSVAQVLGLDCSRPDVICSNNLLSDVYKSELVCFKLKLAPSQ